jgi:hypothetical protein
LDVLYAVIDFSVFKKQILEFKGGVKNNKKRPQDKN